MTDSSAGFGPYLEARIRESGLSQRRIAELAGVDEGTIRAYVRGYTKRRGIKIDVSLTVATVVKLADALEVNRAEMLGAAGLEVPTRVLAQQPRPGEPSNDQLLEILRRRLEAPDLGPANGERFDPSRRLTNEQIRTRGAAIAALKTAANRARAAGDDEAADAICELVGAMDAQLVAMTAAEVSEARLARPASNGE